MFYNAFLYINDNTFIRLTMKELEEIIEIVEITTPDNTYLLNKLKNLKLKLENEINRKTIRTN